MEHDSTGNLDAESPLLRFRPAPIVSLNLQSFGPGLRVEVSSVRDCQACAIAENPTSDGTTLNKRHELR